ncbi:MAG: MMPL family transporter [Hylemonella sp.]|nr:MMPL family transporter [Hylemonella sp.]
MRSRVASHCLGRALWALAMLLCALVVMRTEFRADFSAFLPRQPSPEQQILVEQLQDGAGGRMLLIGIEGSDARVLAALSQHMAAALRRDPLLRQVQNGERDGYAADQALLFSARYLLSPRVQPERFSAAGLHQALQESLDELGASTGLLTKDLLARDPTGEMLTLLDVLLPDGGPRLRHGHWFNAGGQRTLLLIETQASGAQMDAQEQAMASVRSAFDQAQRDVPQAQDARLLVSGPGVFAVSARDAIRNEATHLALMSSLIIIGLLYAIYRSFTVLALGLLPVLSGALVGVAAVSVGFGAVHGMTLGFGATLIGEAVDYAIYLFVQRGPSGQDPDFMQRFWPTIRLGVLTSTCGFAALLLSGFNGLAQLGLFSLAGLVAAALVTRWVLPGLLPTGFAVRDVTPLGLRLQALVPTLRRGRVPLLALTLAAALLLGLRHETLWNHELAALSPVPLATQQLDAELRADMAAPDVRHLIVLRAPDVQAALQRCEALLPALDALVRDGELAGYVAPCRYLPSLAMQAARQQALPDAPTLRRNLEQALEGLPIRADFLAPFLLEAEAARTRALLTPADLQAASFSSALNATLTQSGTHVSALIQLRATASGPRAYAIDPQRVRAALGPLLDEGTVLLDLKAASDRLYHQYLNEALVLSGLSLCGIVALLAWQLRSAQRVLAVVLPLLSAVLLVAAGLHLAGVRMNLLHLVGLLLIVAVGSNYALFFDTREPGGQSPQTLASLLFANLTTVAGFGLLAFSSVPVLQAFGTTVGPGAMGALLFSAILSRDAPAPLRP